MQNHQFAIIQKMKAILKENIEKSDWIRDNVRNSDIGIFKNYNVETMSDKELFLLLNKIERDIK